MGTNWLKKIAAVIEKKQNSIFTYPVGKQKAYIAHFPEPKDTLERSYFQYCCQMKFYGKLLYWLLNLAALPMSVGLLLKYTRKHMDMSECTNDCVYIRYDLPENIVPNSLRQQFPDMLSIKTLGNRLDKEDVAFLKTIFKRYPFSWMFWLKMIVKVSQYSDTIKKYAPGTIVSCDEYSFTSSAMTAYCRAKGIKRINVMHGEKLYFMRDSFMEYDAYYVWDQHYADLLAELRAEKEQFRVEVPASILFCTRDRGVKTVDYTYYLAAEEHQTLEKIAASMKHLQAQGNTVFIRPHPRYSNLEQIKQLFDGIGIENGAEVSIEQSLRRTHNAISLYSSTLNQAYHNGTGVVIDDLSTPDQFRKLKELKYCMLAKEHRLLSEIMGENL